MIEKKNPKHSLEKNRATVFTIGLLAAGSFTLAAFTYESPLEIEEAKIASIHSDVEYFTQAVEKETPEVPKIETPEVQDQQEQTISLDATLTEDISTTESKSDQVKSNISIEGLNIKKGIGDIYIEAKKVESEIILFPDVEAEFIGGRVAMVQFINNTMSYPQDAIDMDEQGRIQLTFVVEKDGSVSNVEVVKGGYKSLNREASRIIRSFPNWKPAESAGKKVRSRINIPIVFTLQ